MLAGGDTHHWAASVADGRRWFLTCDDLRTKPWLGDDEDTVFEHLLAAYGSAIDLGAKGLSAVVAPIPSRSGRPAERLDARHSAASRRPVVVTHGEPHPGNLIRTASGLRLVDRDTVAASAPERHLWMLALVEPTVVERYRDLTGTELDDEHALLCVRQILEDDEPRPFGPTRR